MIIIIYFDEKKTCRQVIRPTPEFKMENVLSIVEHVTGTLINQEVYIKRYHSYEIIR